MASSALFCTHSINTPLEKYVESLVRISFIETPATLNEALELGKEFLDRIEVG